MVKTATLRGEAHTQDDKSKTRKESDFAEIGGSPMKTRGLAFWASSCIRIIRVIMLTKDSTADLRKVDIVYEVAATSSYPSSEREILRLHINDSHSIEISRTGCLNNLTTSFRNKSLACFALQYDSPYSNRGLVQTGTNR